MRIFAGGIATETNTFSPFPTVLGDFTVARGRTGCGAHAAHLDLTRTWGAQAKARGDDFNFSLMAWAEPAGITTRSAFEALRDELLADLRLALPVDVVLLNLHGAMVADGYADCEADMIGRVRAMVGPDTVVGVELDLHCHLCPEKLACADVVITYKQYPHIDVEERGRELFDLAIATRLGQLRPTMALFDCRMVGFYPTTHMPMNGFIDAIRDAEHRPSILSISFGHGFQFADLPTVGAKILAITDDNRALAAQVADEFGTRVHSLRHNIGFERLSKPMGEALSRALAAPAGPVVVADQSDNVGGGAPGDSTFAIRWLMDRGAASVGVAILHDPEAVRVARAAGIGSTISVRLGGRSGIASGPPLDIEAAVTSIRLDHVHGMPQPGGGTAMGAMADFVALQSNGIDIVISSERCQCYSPDIFADLGIDPAARQVLVVKSYQHFQYGFAPIAAEIVYMAAPGAVPPDPRQISYTRLNTNDLYPWVNAPTLGLTMQVGFR